MPSEESFINLYGDREHEHLLESDRFGWDKLGLIYELEPAAEMPEAVTQAHTLVVCQGEFQASFFLNGRWHHEQYTKGDIALFCCWRAFSESKNRSRCTLNRSISTSRYFTRRYRRSY